MCSQRCCRYFHVQFTMTKESIDLIFFFFESLKSSNVAEMRDMEEGSLIGKLHQYGGYVRSQQRSWRVTTATRIFWVKVEILATLDQVLPTADLGAYYLPSPLSTRILSINTISLETHGGKMWQSIHLSLIIKSYCICTCIIVHELELYPNLDGNY